MPIQLCERNPSVPKDRLLGELVPPPRFADVSFDSYRPDPDQPSQQEAVDVLRQFVETLNAPAKGGWFSRRLRSSTEQSGPGGVVNVVTRRPGATPRRRPRP